MIPSTSFKSSFSLLTTVIILSSLVFFIFLSIFLISIGIVWLIVDWLLLLVLVVIIIEFTLGMSFTVDVFSSNWGFISSGKVVGRTILIIFLSFSSSSSNSLTLICKYRIINLINIY